MCEKTFKIKTIFFQTIQFFDGILYNILLLLFGGLFISGGLRPPPKWPIASASPGSTKPSISKPNKLSLLCVLSHHIQHISMSIDISSHLNGFFQSSCNSRNFLNILQHKVNTMCSTWNPIHIWPFCFQQLPYQHIIRSTVCY